MWPLMKKVWTLPDLREAKTSNHQEALRLQQNSEFIIKETRGKCKNQTAQTEETGAAQHLKMTWICY